MCIQINLIELTFYYFFSKLWFPLTNDLSCANNWDNQKPEALFEMIKIKQSCERPRVIHTFFCIITYSGLWSLKSDNTFRFIPFHSTPKSAPDYLIRDENRYQTSWAQSIFRGTTNKKYTWSLLHIFEHPFANSFRLIFILAFCSLPTENKRDHLNVRFAKNKKKEEKKLQQQTSSSARYLVDTFLSNIETKKRNKMAGTVSSKNLFI